MARGGNPNLTWTEDRLIVSAQRGRSSEWRNGELEDFAKLRSFLRGKFSDVGDDQIEEFLKTTNRVRTDYVLLLIRAKKGIYLTRNSLRKKYGMLRTTLMGFLNAMTDSFGPPWEVVRQIDCGGRPDESATTRAKYDSLDFDRFTEQLTSLGVAIAKFESCLQGTAQDRTRPERYLIHELWSKWTELGFPQPRLVRGADLREPDAPDEDAFAEAVRLVFDALYADTKFIEGEVTYNLRAVIVAGQKNYERSQMNFRSCPNLGPNYRLKMCF